MATKIDEGVLTSDELYLIVVELLTNADIRSFGEFATRKKKLAIHLGDNELCFIVDLLKIQESLKKRGIKAECKELIEQIYKCVGELYDSKIPISYNLFDKNNHPT